jgi:hypothetical protein
MAFFASFGHNALINLDSAKWIEIFGTILTLFGRASCIRKKHSEGDLKIFARQAAGKTFGAGRVGRQ